MDFKLFVNKIFLLFYIDTQLIHCHSEDNKLLLSCKTENSLTNSTFTLFLTHKPKLKTKKIIFVKLSFKIQIKYDSRHGEGSIELMMITLIQLLF